MNRPGTYDPAAAPERIAIFRALMLGDMLCAVPAMRAVRAAFPQAHITLVGLPWARGLAERITSVDDFIAMPGYPGLPEIPCDMAQLPAFLADVRGRSFDLALQLHGSGSIVNPLVASFGAAATAGFYDEMAWMPPADRQRYAEWPRTGHEIERLLCLTDHLGLPRQGTHLEFPLTAADRAEAQGLLAALPPGVRLAVVHAGAQLPSRRWPLDRFAAVAQRLLDSGLQVVLTGGPQEVPMVAELARQLHGDVLDVAGRTSLWGLGAVIERAELVVCNDTGTSHIAAALRRRSLVVSSGSDVARWAPLDKALHQVLWRDMPCRPCAFAECPHGHGCAVSLGVEEVMARLPQQREPLHV